MTVFMAELKRYARRTTPFLIILALMLCALMLCFFSRDQTLPAGYTMREYAQIQEQALALPHAEQIHFLEEFSKSKLSLYSPEGLNEEELKAYNTAEAIQQRISSYRQQQRQRYAAAQLLHEATTLRDYASYLAGIQSQSKRMTAFSAIAKQNEFSKRNILKTAEDYAKLTDVVPVMDRSAGVLLFAQMPGGMWLIVSGVLLLGIVLVAGERPYFALYRVPPKGRKELIAAKALTLALFVILLVTGVLAVYAITGACFYGLGDVMRPIQSVFPTTSLHTSVLTYMLMVYAHTLLTALLYGGTVLLLCLLFASEAGITASLALLVAGSAVLKGVISPFSPFNVLKYFNLFTLLDSSVYLVDYNNLNLFGYPVSLRLFTPIAIAVAAALLLVAACVRFARTGRALSLGTWPLRRRAKRPAQKEKPLRGTVNLFLAEGWRIWIGKGVIGFVLLVCAVQAVRMAAFPLATTPYDRSYQYYIDKALAQEDAYQWAVEEQERLLASEAPNYVQRLAIGDVVERCAYLQSIDNPNAVLLYDIGYQKLFTGESGIIYALLVAFGVALCVLQARKQKMEKMLRTLPHYAGRGTLCTLGHLLIATFVIALVSAVPDLIRCHQVYGLPALDAAAESLPYLGTSGGLTLLQTLAFMYSVRLLAAVCLALVLYALSRAGAIVTLLALFLLILLPLLLEWLGVSFVQSYFPSRLLKGCGLL